jgi:hypothetical protein
MSARMDYFPSSMQPGLRRVLVFSGDEPAGFRVRGALLDAGAAHARESACDIARHDSPAGVSPEAAVAEIVRS